ncbi:hypothetical protein AA0119_g5456 [Alternaria tenuissima]|uniref:Uncharacterized protein n=1 Tax=Alternaria tenuissima TaxID=119927 RepID=A0ABY0GET3_9PLEO|nr:hypothetical protein AA0119_g5456 [Alternaria tenuissima]RYO14996.1 hypothetical protein AA0121_g7404 [Alternaria tenuissima]
MHAVGCIDSGLHTGASQLAATATVQGAIANSRSVSLGRLTVFTADSEHDEGRGQCTQLDAE